MLQLSLVPVHTHVEDLKVLLLLRCPQDFLFSGDKMKDYV